MAISRLRVVLQLFLYITMSTALPFLDKASSTSLDAMNMSPSHFGSNNVTRLPILLKELT